MGFAAALILGLIQGLTEFFPVSSSGHLVLGQAVLGVHAEGILMEVLLHVGTALVVLFFYREKVIDLLRPRFDRARNRYRIAIVAGLVPTGFAGVFLKDRIEELFERPGPTTIALAVTGVILLLTRLAPKRERELTYRIAFLIGVAQAIAILPGISRSGATIATALFLGLRRKEAAEFSFLLSVPAILGAALLTARDLGAEAAAGGVLLPALAGTAVAILSGYLALRFLVGIVLAGKIDRFGWYCLAVAAAGAVALTLS
ncbi:MAG: undecaprenyl-diphosphate phosphatase [Candidatus Eisenbacteria bacterium]|nr:undecaprenyl-diphosphate phosphatase [Candidatus Eisenbacteria bacterium]